MGLTVGAVIGLPVGLVAGLITKHDRWAPIAAPTDIEPTATLTISPRRALTLRVSIPAGSRN